MANENFEEKCWYSFLDEHNRAEILSNSTVVDYSKGETIIKQGVAPGQIPYLEKGMVKLTSTNNKRTTTFKIIADNTFIGLMCAFVKKRFDFSAIAIMPSTVRMIDRSLFEEAIRTNGEFAVHVVHEMSLTTNLIVTELIQLNHKNADGAICTILFELATVFKSNTFQLPFNRIEFADTVGYSKESVINCLSSLQQQEIIKVSGKTIEIIDMNRLETIAMYG
ncbi:MAG: Crp/Fnr family transcriptional regulator [Bacteroidales bacterium]|jgi:CRP-like cAMP-binding protein|nr:Crp/Fnr family transcriptional regulator [Bacteroidales bacterium]MDD4384767.1 Crp/Fnr family transcriptional regulator [Bacteroidales bacterium]MDY0198063.1 Crp/Fnr family transcriptional regulator [Tenuifilaceae bacterium]